MLDLETLSFRIEVIPVGKVSTGGPYFTENGTSEIGHLMVSMFLSCESPWPCPNSGKTHQKIDEVRVLTHWEAV